MKFKGLLQSFLLFGVLVCLSSCGTSSVKNDPGEVETALWLVKPKDRAGEISALDGIAAALVKEQIVHTSEDIPIVSSEAISAVEVNLLREKVRAFLESHPSSQALVIGIGTSGVQALPLFNEQNLQDASMQALAHRIVTVYTSHQLMGNFRALLRTKNHPAGVSLISYPQHIVNMMDASTKEAFAQTTTKVVSTIGVPHNTSVDSVIRAYQEAPKGKNPTEMPDLNKAFTIIMLGGDVETGKGEWVLYTPQQASQLAKNIWGLSKQAADPDEKVYEMLLFNGPRTGKFNFQGGKLVENLGAHADPQKLDAVTQVFVTEFDGLSSVKMRVFHWVKGQKSLWQAALGLAYLSANGEKAQAKVVDILIPGESTSMISEAVDVLKASPQNSGETPKNSPSQVIVFMHGAMQKTHHAHVQSEYEAGRIRVFGEDGKFWPKKTALGAANFLTAADTIALAIRDQLNLNK